MKPLRTKAGFSMLAGAVLLGGCTVGPDYQRPETLAEGPDAFVHADKPVLEAPPFDRWWESFADPVTEELVERALAANTDLQAAAARVLESAAIFDAVSGARQPSLSARLDGSRSASVVDPGGANFRSYETALSPSLNVSWSADLFGQLKRSQRAAWADLLSAEASREALTHVIVAEVVRARVNIATLQRRLALAEQIVKSRRETLRSVERRYERGAAGDRGAAVSAVDLRLARENVSAAESTIPLIRQQLFNVRHGLDVLLNVRPARTGELPETLPPVPSLEPVAVPVPAALLDRRPDLRAAEFRTIAATERVGVAVADLYPNLTLSANVAGQGSNLGEVLRPDALLASVAGNLVQRIFEGGRLKANVRAAEARVMQAAAEYAGDVLNAMREVEDALVADDLIQKRLVLLRQRVAEATAAERSARERYQRGVESLLSVLEAERRARLAEEELILAEEALWDARIRLYLALGGDWTDQVTPPIELEFLDTPSRTDGGEK